MKILNNKVKRYNKQKNIKVKKKIFLFSNYLQNISYNLKIILLIPSWIRLIC